MTAWIKRRDAAMPFQEWHPFPDDAIVQVRNAHGDTNIGPSGSFWWGYETEFSEVAESVITQARRIDRARETSHDL